MFDTAVGGRPSLLEGRWEGEAVREGNRPLWKRQGEDQTVVGGGGKLDGWF